MIFSLIYHARRHAALVAMVAVMPVLALAASRDLEAAHPSTAVAPQTPPSPPSQSPNALWEPPPAPAGCAAANVHLLLTDISGSMAKLLDLALEQQATYVLRAPDCTYVVYAVFGTTGRIVVDGFLTSPDERQRIARDIRRRPRTHQNTNFDEAAKLVELTLLKIERTYAGLPWSFTTTVISDFIPDPSEGHTPFDLHEYLAQRQLQTRVGVLQVEIVPSGVIPSRDEVRAAGGRLTVSVRGLSDVLEAVLFPAPIEDTASTSTALPPSDNPDGLRDTGGWFLELWWEVATLVLLVLLLLFIRLRRAGPVLPDLGADKMSIPEQRVPSAFRLTEHVVDQAGAVVEELRQHEEIPVAEGVPVVFSTEPDADVRLDPVRGVPADTSFSVTPLAAGQLRLAGSQGLTCNGARRVPPKGVVVDSAVPLRIELGDRRWIVAPVWADATRVDQFLAVPQPLT